MKKEAVLKQQTRSVLLEGPASRYAKTQRRETVGKVVAIRPLVDVRKYKSYRDRGSEFHDRRHPPRQDGDDNKYTPSRIDAKGFSLTLY